MLPLEEMPWNALVHRQICSKQTDFWGTKLSVICVIYMRIQCDFTAIKLHVYYSFTDILVKRIFTCLILYYRCQVTEGGTD